MQEAQTLTIEIKNRERAVSEQVDNSPLFFRTTHTESTFVEEMAAHDFNRSKPLMPVPELSEEIENPDLQRSSELDQISDQRN